MTKFTKNVGLKTFLFGFLSVLFVAFLAVSSYGQSLTTDMPDYPPGSTVILTGSGFGANETVTMQVKHFPDCCNNSTSPDHQPWYITADGNGDFTTFWFVDDDESGATLKATADGQSTAYHAEAFFTDAAAITLYSLATRTTASESDAFAWGSTVYVKLTSALDRRCYKIVWTNGATTFTTSSPATGTGTGNSNRNIDVTIPASGPSGIWTIQFYEGNTQDAVGACTANLFPGGYTLLSTHFFDVAHLVIVGATDDNDVNQNAPGSVQESGGLGNQMLIESRINTQNKRSFIKFNTSSITASPITVTDAKLRLFMLSAPNVTRNYDAYLITGPNWGETTITWTNQPGVAATATNQQPTGIISNTLIRWSVTADVTSIANGITSYGWRINDHTETDGNTGDYISSFQTKDNNQSGHIFSHGPVLLVDYNPCVAPTLATAGSDSPVCEGSILHLNSSVSGYPAPTASWSGTGAFSPSNTDANPTVTGAATGTYMVTYTNACGSTSASVEVTINTAPSSATAGSNSPICEGSDLNLTSSANGTPTPTYAWTGPNSFTSTDQNPTITGAVAADATGTYYVTATNTCGSETANVAVTVIPTPTAGFAPTTISGSNATIHFSGTPNVEVTYNIDGGPPLIIILDGSGNASLGPIPVTSTDQTYNLVSVRYTTGPECIYTLTGYVTLGLSTTNLYSNKDTYIEQAGNGNNVNEGNNPLLQICASCQTRALVGFDLTGVSTTNLLSARLVMYIDANTITMNWGGGAPGSSDPSTRYVDVARLLEDWIEGNGCNQGCNPNTRGTGAGATWKSPNDANIYNNSPNGPLWSGDWGGTPSGGWGGNFAAPTAPSVLHYNGLVGEVSWDVTQDVFDGAQYGWIIKKKDETQNGRVNYQSRENTNKPRLELTYVNASPGKPLGINIAEGGQSLDQISIFPNPAKEAFTLQLTNSINQGSILTLYDLTGKGILQTVLQLQAGIDKYPVSITGISPGVYIVRLQTGTATRQARLLINR